MQQVGKLVFILLLLFSSFLYADDALLKRKNVIKFINTMVNEYGFNKNELKKTLEQATFQPKIIRSMERPYEKKNWDFYQTLFLTSDRVQKGIKFWKENQSTLNEAEKKYGVSPEIIVAILGVETLYGERQGNYRVLDALTTLAFNYPKRAKFFTKELREYLILCKEQGVNPTEIKGSYAGAIGKPQFMPSSYRFYAVDFTGNGKRDLIRDNRDVIGSVANYFHRHGWKKNAPVAQPAQIKGNKYRKIRTNTRHADYSKKTLLAAGVYPQSQFYTVPKKMGLIELVTQAGKEFWIAYPNFYVITRYNVSPQYALVVYLLSKDLQSQWKNTHHRAISDGLV